MAGTDDDISLEEKRVYGAKAGRTDVYVAARPGLVRVAVSGDKIGEFGVVCREEARDVAALPTPDGEPDRLAVATAGGVLVGEAGDDPAFADAGFGAAVAVGAHDDHLLVADEDGRIARSRVSRSGGGRRSDGDWESDDWEPIGGAGDVRAISGPLVASDAGAFRVAGDELSNVGLADVRDVAGAGVPLAAAGDGLYWLGNGWMDALSGTFVAVASDGAGHALAAGGALYSHDGDEWDADAWSVADLPVEEAVVELAYGPGLAVAVTDAGTICVNAGDGWRHQVVGVRDVGGAAVASGR